MSRKKEKRAAVEIDPTEPVSGAAHDNNNAQSGLDAQRHRLELERPPELPPLAREEWQRIVGELIAVNILSRFDRCVLAIYCAAYAAWAEALDAIQKFGMMIKSPTGYPVQSRYVAILNRNADIMLQIAREFGFAPASRSRNFSFAKSNSMLLLKPDPEDRPGGPKPLDDFQD